MPVGVRNLPWQGLVHYWRWLLLASGFHSFLGFLSFWAIPGCMPLLFAMEKAVLFPRLLAFVPVFLLIWSILILVSWFLFIALELLWAFGLLSCLLILITDVKDLLLVWLFLPVLPLSISLILLRLLALRLLAILILLFQP